MRSVTVLLLITIAVLAGCSDPAAEPEAVATATHAASAPRTPSTDDGSGSSSAPAAETTTPTPTATPTPVMPTPTATVVVVGVTDDGAREVEIEDDSERSDGLRPRPPKPPRPEPTPTVSARLGRADTEGGKDETDADEEQRYTWYDGDRTVTVWLRADLVVQPTTQNTAEDVVISAGGVESIVERQPRHGSDALPVFRTPSGSLMTLPGGVIVVLDSSWDQTRVEAFFTEHGVDRATVTEQTFTANAFLLDTGPGFPSLELANALAVQDGVRISSPNWRRETELR